MRAMKKKNYPFDYNPPAELLRVIWNKVENEIKLSEYEIEILVHVVKTAPEKMKLIKQAVEMGLITEDVPDFFA
jgi:translation initiation factor 2 alpha subunit (eIF-2alpha)